MEIIVVLFAAVMVVFILVVPLVNREEPMPIKEQPKKLAPVVRPTAPQYTKAVEATEKSTEFPDGTIVTVRNVRQWQ